MTTVNFDEIAALHAAAYEIDLDEATHVYTVRHAGAPGGEAFQSVTSFLQECGLYPSFAGADPADVEAARFRGSNVHLATELLDTAGGLDWSSLTDDEVPFVQAYDTFREEIGFQPVMIERAFASLPYRVAGKTDRLGLLRDGEPCVADVKTGDIAACTALQLAAYGWLADPRHVWRRFAVRLKPTGVPLVKEFPIEEYARDVSVFLSTISVTQWRHLYVPGANRRKAA
jgi:hypothetical protein